MGVPEGLAWSMSSRGRTIETSQSPASLGLTDANFESSPSLVKFESAAAGAVAIDDPAARS